MDITIIPTVIGVIISAPSVFKIFKDIFDFLNPTSNQLKKYITYEKKYSGYYDDEIKDYLKNQIKYLSLFNLTTVKDEHAQLIYFEILQKNITNKIDRPLLSNILNSSLIHEDKFIECLSLDCFKSKTSFKRKINYFFSLYVLGINNLIFLPASLYYDIFVLEKNLSLFWITLTLLLIVTAPILISSLRHNVKPISKKKLSNILNVINDWNREVRPEST